MENGKTLKSESSEKSNKPVVQTNYKHSELTGKIIGCAMKVHSALGNGFQEVIYQRALDIEMSDAGIEFSREYEMPVYYKQQQIGTRRVDFLVESVVSVEIKALIKLEDVHLAQAINYLEAYDLEVGLLINFGAKSLEFKRVSNKKFKQKNQGNPKIK
ncbi:GxxExxY protein [Anaerophaga thermohalophila]|uniref:GxxExxY protein n=1 Tax=Anaerophaga thermohalophila TaxID=177400 RepID=UPI000237C4C5|nr:GxxExxY protein [Anaerophaga thermohalophila]